jgi:acylphosphatase
MEVGAHIEIFGMVQGVGFRYFAHRLAVRLGLTGFVRNLYNGNVEIAVEGERSLVEEFISEIKVGPRAAHVGDVKIVWREMSGSYRNFEIR